MGYIIYGWIPDSVYLSFIQGVGVGGIYPDTVLDVAGQSMALYFRNLLFLISILIVIYFIRLVAIHPYSYIW